MRKLGPRAENSTTFRREAVTQRYRLAHIDIEVRLTSCLGFALARPLAATAKAAEISNEEIDEQVGVRATFLSPAEQYKPLFSLAQARPEQT